MTNDRNGAWLDRDATPGAVTAAPAYQSRWPEDVGAVVVAARDALVASQEEDGHWIFPLEADATIPAEYILLEHYLDEIDDDIERRLANYLRRTQGADGGWPLFHAGDMDISATVKAYFALKLVGDDPDAPHMRRARDAVLARGGAAEANVFTRFTLALYGQVPWRAVPTMPVELIHLPRWFPFHLSKVSYWSRTVMVPLVALAALKPCARNPRGVSIDELFAEDPFKKRDWLKNPTGSPWGAALLQLDRVLRRIEPHLPMAARQRAMDKALGFCRQRLNGEDGLGGIFPAMANHAMLLDALGTSRNAPDFATVRRAIRKLLLVNNGEAMCQPCLSPVWDTALALLALIESGETGPVVDKAARWLVERQVTDVKGDWAVVRPDATPGGWAFQYRNDYYPDADDSAAVLMALARAGTTGERRGDPHRHRVDPRDAVGEWRVGRVRRRQHPLRAEPHPVRRSRRAARPADLGRDRALRRHAGRVRLRARPSRRRARPRLPPCRAGAVTAHGTGAGAPTTSTAPGRCCRR